MVPKRFVTIDPGLNASGVALWNEGLLHSVRLVRVPRGTDKTLTNRINVQSMILSSLLSELGYAQSPVICECMFHRHYRGNKVDPNDLINLNLLAGRLGTHYVWPSAWKGNVPRDVEQSHSEAVLHQFELDLVQAVLPASLRKEAWSAVGIGLSVLSRAHQQIGWRFS